MSKMIIDLQIACEQETGLPTVQQIEHWATAAVQPQSDEVEMTVRIVDEAESHALNLKSVRRRNKTNPSWRIGRTWWCTAACICLVTITLKMTKQRKWKAWRHKL